MSDRQLSTPAAQADRAAQLWGVDQVVADCVTVLGQPADALPCQELLGLVGLLGRGALPSPAELEQTRAWLAGGRPPGHRYWARVWAIRALSFVWSDDAGPAVVRALDDEHWRVREFAAKVVAGREVPDATDRLLALIRNDPTPRVRAASCRALGAVGEGEHLAELVTAGEDSDPHVSAAAVRALAQLERRLDRFLH